MKADDRVRIKTEHYRGREGVILRVWHKEEEPYEVLITDTDICASEAKVFCEETDLEIIAA